MEYVHGQMYIDEVILQDDQTTVYYFALDRRYSTTALMNTSGSVVETYDYKVYGKRVASGSGLTEMGYTGRRHDDETGLMYFRNRYYSVDRGSFVTRDSLGYVDGYSMYLGYFGGQGLDPQGLSGKGEVVGWVVKMVYGKLIKTSAIYTHKYAAKIYLKGGQVLLKDGARSAEKVANIVYEKAQAILRKKGGKTPKGNIEKHKPHELPNPVTGIKDGVTGSPHFQLSKKLAKDVGVEGSHIFYTGLAALLTTIDCKGAEYDMDIIEVYKDGIPESKPVLAPLSITYHVGEDSAWRYLDWLNPLDLLAAASEFGDQLDKEFYKEYLGVAITVKKHNMAIFTFNLDKNGDLISVKTWKDDMDVSAEDFFKRLAESSTKDE